MTLFASVAVWNSVTYLCLIGPEVSASFMGDNAFYWCLFSFYPVTRFSQSRRRRKSKWTSWRMCPHNMRWEILLLSVIEWGFFFCPPVNHYLKCFLPDSLMAAGRTSVHQRRDWGPPVCTCQQLRDRRRPAAETRHHSWVRCRPDSYGSSLLPNLEKEKMDKSRLLDYNVTRLSQ